MALPNSRDLTVAKGTQCPSTLLNNIQDQIIALASGGTGQVTEIELGTSPNQVRLKATSPDELHVRNFADTADGDIRFADHKHGDRTFDLIGAAGASSKLVGNAKLAAVGFGQARATSDFLSGHFPLPMQHGDRIKQIDISLSTSSEAGTRTAELRHLFDNGGFSGVLASVTWGPSEGFAPFKSIVSLNETVGPDRLYFLRFDDLKENPALGGDDVVSFVRVIYDRP